MLPLGCEVHPRAGLLRGGPWAGGRQGGRCVGHQGADPSWAAARWAWGLGGRGLDLETGCWELDSELCCCGVDSELACWERSPERLVSDFFLLPFFMVDPPDLSVHLHGAA